MLHWLFFVHFCSLVSFVPVSVSNFVFFSYWASLIWSISFSLFLHPHSSFFSSPAVSLSLSRQWAVCSSLHVDTPAPPCSSHKWAPGFILTQERENSRRRGRDRKDKKKKQDKEKGRGVVAAGAWAWSVSSVDLRCSNIWFKN